MTPSIGVRYAAILTLASCLAGCQTLEGNIAAQLRPAGLSLKVRECIADDLGERLSAQQLGALLDAFRARSPAEKSSVRGIEEIVRAIPDPAIVAAAEAASAGCFPGECYA